MSFFGTLGDYISAKNKLNELLYNLNKDNIENNIENSIEEFNVYIDSLEDLDNEEKTSVKKSGLNEFKKKLFELGIETTIKNLF